MDKQNKIYGQSDDLIEFDFEGFEGEFGCFDPTKEDPVLVVVSDGTVLSVYYGKGGNTIWGIEVLKKGTLFDRIDPCDDEDAEIYSDQALFSGPVKWAYAAKEWERVS
jgi:hypothetical protein